MTTEKINSDDFIKRQQEQIHRLSADNARLKHDLCKERHFNRWLAFFFRGLSPQKALPMLEN